MTRTDYLIRIISSYSNRYGDKLIDFLSAYNLTGLQYATEEQLEEYIAKEHFNGIRSS